MKKIGSQFPKELTDKFIIGKYVDGGSYGNVNMVQRISDGKIYAMKTVARNPDGSSWKNIETEMQVLSFVNPYKLHLDCFFMEGNTVYMIVDWCPNTLAKYITDMEPGGFDEKEIWRLFIQICFGLESLHYNEFIHRDLHLKNVLLDENSNIKIADFGISRYMQTSKIEGAEAIRSPRGCRGWKEDIQTKESDIWAVGCALYYLCTLQDPFNGDPNRIQHELHRDIREFHSGYSEQLKDFVDRCLKKDRRERPTIIDILTDKFIVDKTRELMIEIPQTSIMKTASLQIELSTYKSGEGGPLNLQLKSELSDCRNENANQNSEIQQLKAEIASLKNIITAKGNYIEILRLKAVGIFKLLEKRKSVNEKQLAEVKNSIRDFIADAERSKKILDYSEQDLNVKETEIAQIEIITEQNLMDKRSKILKNSNNNSSELENEFRRTCSVYQNHSTTHDESVTQAYQNYLKTYHQQTSLFNLLYKNEESANLLIYNTETETQELKVLQIPLDKFTCITQLPNGKLFCFGRYNPSGNTLLIDVNNDYRVEELPSGAFIWFSSGIYFNNNVYCFGRMYMGSSTLSSRFDLDSNKWNELAPLPNAEATCNSIIFNGSILISGLNNKNLWRYSIANNSFTTIPYDFAENNQKFLINAERLYLIECGNGSIYESEIGSDAAWRRITDSIIGSYIHRIYCQYNKGGIYIGCTDYNSFKCFKFNLNEKRLIKLV